MSHRTTLVNTQSVSEQRLVDGTGSPLTQNIVLNNCLDVHIGPKYVRTNNITIKGSPDIEVQNSFGSVIYKCLKVPYGIKLKIIFCGSSFLLIVFVIITLTLFTSQTEPEISPTPSISSTTTSPSIHTPSLTFSTSSAPWDNEDYPVSKRFVTRDGWGAAPPSIPLSNNTLPLERAIFIHTVTGTCDSFSSCRQVVLSIQRQHIPKYEDIMYNFLIGNDGHIFVGRGWDKLGRHTKNCDMGSLGVAFIGDFRSDIPSPEMLQAAKTLLDVGVERSKLSKEYQLFGHCQVHSGFPCSPGVNILRKIMSWPHWNDMKQDQCVFSEDCQ